MNKIAAVLIAVVALALVSAAPPRQYRPSRWPAPKRLAVTWTPLIDEQPIAAHAIRWRDIDSPGAGKHWQIVFEIANTSDRRVLSNVNIDIGLVGGGQLNMFSITVKNIERGEPAWIMHTMWLGYSSGPAPPFRDIVINVSSISAR